MRKLLMPLIGTVAILLLLLVVVTSAEKSPAAQPQMIDLSRQVLPDSGDPDMPLGHPDKSGCTWLYYYGTPSYYFDIPDPYGSTMLAQRFTSPGPKLLESVAICVYNSGVGPYFDVIVYVVGDNAGMPNLSDMIHKAVIPYTSMVYYPSFNYISLSGMNVMVDGDFHVVCWPDPQSDQGTLTPFLSDDGSLGDNRSAVYNLGSWQTIQSVYGMDVNFVYEVELCDCCELRGDFNHDSQVDATDIVAWVAWAFNGNPTGPVCLAELDMNGDGQVDVSDLIQWVRWAYSGGEGPTPCPVIAR